MYDIFDLYGVVFMYLGLYIIKFCLLLFAVICLNVDAFIASLFDIVILYFFFVCEFCMCSVFVFFDGVVCVFDLLLLFVFVFLFVCFVLLWM